MPISITEGLQNYRAAVEAPLAQQEAKDRATLLSAQAEAAKEKMAAYKEEQALSMQRKAALGALARERSDLNISNTDGQIKLSDLAIQQNRDNPALVEKFQEEKQSLLKRRVDELKVNAEAREQERAQKYDVLSEVLAAPELSDKLTTSGDPALQHFGEMIAGRKPIAQFRDANGKPKMYSQLSGEELSRFREQVLSGVAPKGDAAAMARYAQHEIEWARMQESMRKHDQDAIAASQKTAASRDKIAAPKAAETRARDVKIAEQEVAKTKAISAVDNKILAIMQKAGVSKEDETTWYGSDKLSDADKATIKALKDQKAELATSYDKAIALLKEADTILKEPPKKASGTKENPIKLD